MYIEEIEGEGEGEGGLRIEGKKTREERKEEKEKKGGDDTIVLWDAKRVCVGAGARALFYPTLLYNVVRNKIQSEFRWWDWIDQFVLLGAVPFCSDVSRLKELGVSGVITLNEPYETLVPTSLYEAHGIRNLVLPTRDYLFAPSLDDICQAVEFIHGNASCGESTYVHCKAGRGRSTTIVVCYLVKYKQMTPDVAYDYVKSIRPRVLLASAQWQAVQDFYYLRVKKICSSSFPISLVPRRPTFFATRDVLAFDDGSVVVITKADLEGYDPKGGASAMGSQMWADLSLIYGVRLAGGAALRRLSCFWLRYHATQREFSTEELTSESRCSAGEKQLGGFTVDIHVY